MSKDFRSQTDDSLRVSRNPIRNPIVKNMTQRDYFAIHILSAQLVARPLDKQFSILEELVKNSVDVATILSAELQK